MLTVIFQIKKEMRKVEKTCGNYRKSQVNHPFFSRENWSHLILENE